MQAIEAVLTWAAIGLLATMGAVGFVAVAAWQTMREGDGDDGQDE